RPTTGRGTWLRGAGRRDTHPGARGAGGGEGARTTPAPGRAAGLRAPGDEHTPPNLAGCSWGTPPAWRYRPDGRSETGVDPRRATRGVDARAPTRGDPPGRPARDDNLTGSGYPHPHAPGGVALRSVSGLRCIDGGVDDGNAGRDGAPFEHVQLRAET